MGNHKQNLSFHTKSFFLRIFVGVQNPWKWSLKMRFTDDILISPWSAESARFLYRVVGIAGNYSKIVVVLNVLMF